VLDGKSRPSRGTQHAQAPACAPSAGGVPSPRWGASGLVATVSHSWSAGQASRQPAGRGPKARRGTRGAGTRRRHDSVDRPVARRARSMRWGALDPGLRPLRPAARNVPQHEGRSPSLPCGARHDVEGRRVVRSHGVVVAAARWGAARLDSRDQTKVDRTTARRPVVQSPGLGASPPCGTAARRGVSSRPSTKGCGVTPAPGVLVHWLGVAAARRLLCPTFHHLEITSLFARRRRRSRARTAQEPHPSRHGSSAARRPAPRQDNNSDASHLLGSHHRKGSKEEKRVEGPRCSRWGDGVVVVGLSVAWHRCSGREGVPGDEDAPVV
jgi:hypothetical protein